MENSETRLHSLVYKLEVSKLRVDTMTQIVILLKNMLSTGPSVLKEEEGEGPID